MVPHFVVVLAILITAVSAAAQDVRGLEICTAEKAMDRRTSCLQSNVEFLHQTLARLTRETQSKLAAADREIVAQKTEIAALRAALVKLQHEFAELKKPKADKN
jgi:septal ring factor EnvC (AmiA/AmiB activator)